MVSYYSTVQRFSFSRAKFLSLHQDFFSHHIRCRRRWGW